MPDFRKLSDFQDGRHCSCDDWAICAHRRHNAQRSIVRHLYRTRATQERCDRVWGRFWRTVLDDDGAWRTDLAL